MTITVTFQKAEADALSPQKDAGFLWSRSPFSPRREGGPNPADRAGQGVLRPRDGVMPSHHPPPPPQAGDEHQHESGGCLAGAGGPCCVSSATCHWQPGPSWVKLIQFLSSSTV